MKLPDLFYNIFSCINLIFQLMFFLHLPSSLYMASDYCCKLEKPQLLPLLMLTFFFSYHIHSSVFRTKWTSPLHHFNSSRQLVASSLTHQGLAPLCVPDACCMLFATVFLTHLCTSSRSVFYSIGRTFLQSKKATRLTGWLSYFITL